jgi:hypothetical protein
MPQLSLLCRFSADGLPLRTGQCVLLAGTGMGNGDSDPSSMERAPQAPAPCIQDPGRADGPCLQTPGGRGRGRDPGAVPRRIAGEKPRHRIIPQAPSGGVVSRADQHPPAKPLARCRGQPPHERQETYDRGILACFAARFVARPLGLPIFPREEKKHWQKLKIWCRGRGRREVLTLYNILPRTSEAVTSRLGTVLVCTVFCLVPARRGPLVFERYFFCGFFLVFPHFFVLFFFCPPKFRSTKVGRAFESAIERSASADQNMGAFTAV